MNEPGQTVASNIDCGHQIEPEQGEVGEVILGQFLAGEMGVQTAKSAEAPLAHTHSLQIRQHDAAGIADDHVFDVAFTIYENAYLAIDLV